MFRNALCLLMLTVSMLASGCASNVSSIETITHKGYCTDQFNRRLNDLECEKKVTEEIHGKPEKPESERILEGVNKAVDKNKKAE